MDKKVRLLEALRAGGVTFTSKNSYWKAAKAQLKREAFGKCAYCEAPTDVVAHGDVEHFRPKSVYWWLAYCYDNFLYACQVCNQTFKGDHFPIHGPRLALDPPLPDPLPAALTAADLRALAARLAPDPLTDSEGSPIATFRRAALAERAGLVDPYMVDPEPLFRWVADPVNKEVTIAPRGRSAAARHASRAVEDHLGLNRDELKRLRWKIYEILETFARTLASPRIDAALRAQVEAQIRGMMDPSAPFAGMARYFVTVEWGLPLAPSTVMPG